MILGDFVSARTTPQWPRPPFRTLVGLVVVFTSTLTAAGPQAGRRAAGSGAPIDRRGLVTRHQPTLTTFDVESPLTVGNGEFAFTVDATGLQTFADLYDQTIPLGTLSQWGWHTSPNPNRWTIDTFGFKAFDSHGRQVGYADIPGERTPEIDWLRANPHRLHLGRIGFSLTRADGSPATSADLTDIRQTLDLWNGAITSHFRLDGESVDVETLCHPTLDAVAVRVRSPLLRDRPRKDRHPIPLRHRCSSHSRLDAARRAQHDHRPGVADRGAVRAPTRCATRTPRRCVGPRVERWPASALTPIGCPRPRARPSWPRS